MLKNERSTDAQHFQMCLLSALNKDLDLLHIKTRTCPLTRTEAKMDSRTHLKLNTSDIDKTNDLC